MPDKIEHLQRRLRERIVILDGAMGTMVHQRQLTEADFRGRRFADWRGKELKGCIDLLNLTQPQIIEDIHRQYLEAGADIIETNTFSSQSISLSDYGLESLAYEASKAGAECARRAADKFMSTHPDRICFVAGASGRQPKRRPLRPMNPNGSLLINWCRLTLNRPAGFWMGELICCSSKPFWIR